MGLLEITNLRLQLNGSPILDGLDMDLWEGHVHAVVGPNGAGKSTLAGTIMGLEGYRDYSGEMAFEGTSLAGLAVDERARLGMTLGWQEPARFEGLRVPEFVRLAARDKRDEAVRDAMARCGLGADRYWDRAADKTLSGGERKKLELASILAMQPRLVMLDEPDSGIDVESLARIRDAIGALRDAGATVVLITHSAEVLDWAEHAFLLCCGRIVDKGNIDRIGRYFKDRCIPCDHKNRPDLNGEGTA
jgi:Fe-S cluster assembly ATP-binding protein